MKKKPLLKHESLDWIGIANRLIPTYLERYKKWANYRPECDEYDFIKTEIGNYEFELTAQFTVGALWDRYEKIINQYILFLKNKLPDKIINNNIGGNKLEYTVKQIALIHAYNGIQLTRDNSKEIAARYGFTSNNSGEGLFQDFTYFSSAANRKGKPINCTAKKLENKIKQFESVFEHLTEPNKKRAEDEINILKSILKSEYL